MHERGTGRPAGERNLVAAGALALASPVVERRKSRFASQTVLEHMAFATIDDVRIYYETHGEVGSTPLVLAYCLGGNCTWLRPQAEALASRYSVILWDPRGHGQSESPADPAAYGITRSAQDLAGLLDHLGIERAHVGGLSMGGGIASRFAQLHPERPLSVLILDSNTAAAQPVAQRMREVREHTAELCDAGDMDAVAAYYLANSPAYQLFAANDDAHRARLHQMVAANDPVGFANTLRAMLKPDSDPADMGRIVAPTLLVAGEHDPAMAAIRLTHEGISGSKLVTIPGAGHLSNVDAPAALLAAVEDFLASMTPS